MSCSCHAVCIIVLAVGVYFLACRSSSSTIDCNISLDTGRNGHHLHSRLPAIVFVSALTFPERQRYSCIAPQLVNSVQGEAQQHSKQYRYRYGYYSDIRLSTKSTPNTLLSLRLQNTELLNQDQTDEEQHDDVDEIIPARQCVEDDEDFHQNLPEGLPKGFYIVKEYTYLPNINPDAFSSSAVIRKMNEEHIYQLGLSNINNITLPIALTILDPSTYPSLSRARKACRKGNVLIIRFPGSSCNSSSVEKINNCNNNDAVTGHQSSKIIGRVGDRVYDGDKVCIQVRMGDGYSFAVVGHTKPPFDVPVVYQDDHYALVNKPAGVVCYRQGASSSGLMSIRAALPFVLYPPKRGTYSVLRRPASVHRLDKPTSGLLCIVKTKPAMIHMSKQFHDRIVQKTYTAIINGIPEENSNSWITSEQAIMDYDFKIEFNLKTQYDCSKSTKWQLIDSPLDDQHAITLWRVLKYVPSLRANDGYITLIECKPKTGRYHQLRRHMAWVTNRPMVGDIEYDGNHPNAIALRGNGLFLCATGITHEHPYYNSVDGVHEWNKNVQVPNGIEKDNSHYENNNIVWFNNVTEKVMVSAQIELPSKFYSLLQREEERYNKFHINPQQQQ